MAVSLRATFMNYNAIEFLGGSIKDLYTKGEGSMS